jgi:hypothetical protein
VPRSRPEPSLGPSPGVGPEPLLRAKRWAAAASAGLLLSILLTATRGAIASPWQDLALLLAPWISVASLAAAIAAAHNLGRCGPDPGEPPPSP